MRTLLRSPVQMLRPSVLNALLRETKDWHYLPATRADELSLIHIPLSPTQPFGFRYAISPHTASPVSFPGNADSGRQRRR